MPEYLARLRQRWLMAFSPTSQKRIRTADVAVVSQRDPELGKGGVQIVPTLWLEAEGELAQEATIRKFRMVREKEQPAQWRLWK